jgi:hypothetical protein
MHFRLVIQVNLRFLVVILLNELKSEAKSRRQAADSKNSTARLANAEFAMHFNSSQENQNGIFR